MNAKLFDSNELRAWGVEVPHSYSAILGGLNEQIQRVLETLYSANSYASTCKRTPWDFAVEIDELLKTGATTAELRWLMVQGWAQHAVETTTEGQSHRTFRGNQGFRFSSNSCFVLSEPGVSLATKVLARRKALATRTKNSVDLKSLQDVQPSWDKVRHELKIGNHLIKKFKWRAQNQETILAAFEEECWPTRIDDPLPPLPGKNPKRRLADTVKCLNRNQNKSLIRFSGDGTGQGVLWEIVEAEG